MRVKFAVVPLPLTAAEKFGEAIYFLNQMVESVNNVRRFPYHLSAFLSALRSTTFYLQAQFSGDEEFTTWYARIQDELKADAALRRLNELRVEAVHKNPVNLVATSGPTLHENPIVTDHLEFMSTTDQDGKIVWRYKVGKDGQDRDAEPNTDWEFEADGRSVLDFCQECLSKIDRVLAEWYALQKPDEKDGQEGSSA
jgi:hypothetical protein